MPAEQQEEEAQTECLISGDLKKMWRERAPIRDIRAWSVRHGVEYNGVEIKVGDKGVYVVATEDMSAEDVGKVLNEPVVLMKVPPPLVIDGDFIKDFATDNELYREIILAVGEPANSTDVAIKLFLLLHYTYAGLQSPDEDEVRKCWTDFVKFLPLEPLLPTMFSDAEREAFYGTTLGLATGAKISILREAFEKLKEATYKIPFCYQHWWGPNGKLQPRDLLLVDAWFRSRAMEMSVGPCFIPCLDMVNHAPDAKANARYLLAADGNAYLYVKPGAVIRAGEEIFISYGFIPEELTDTVCSYYPLSIPRTDEYYCEKSVLLQSPPGIKIEWNRESNANRRTKWTSPYVWKLVVQREDGFEIREVESTETETDESDETETKIEHKVYFQGTEVKDALALVDLMKKDERMNLIFETKANYIVRDILNYSNQELLDSNAKFWDIWNHRHSGATIDRTILEFVKKLRRMDAELLAAAIQDVDANLDKLLHEPVVVHYYDRLAQENAQANPQEEPTDG
ncbi:hypothetical protein KEM55_002595 [Ascosphaera atra]|nr:hypothetical protein KEM55_002595 [Ascosphaera atra]